MGLLSGRKPVTRALTAAAPLTIGNSAPASGRLKGQAGTPYGGSLAQPWQLEGAAFADTAAPLKYASMFTGNAMSRVQLVAGVIPDDGDKPVPMSQLLDPDDKTPLPAGVTPDLCQAAITELSLIRHPDSGQAEIMRALGMHLFVTGDAYLVAMPNLNPLIPGDEIWQVYGVTELRRHGIDRTGRQVWALSGATQPLPDGSVAYRVYRSHAFKRGAADSAVRGILSDLEELALLSQKIRSMARTGLSNGMLLVGEELSFGDPLDPEGADRFTLDLVETMVTPVADEGSAAAVVPWVVRGKSEFLKEVRHLTFERPMEAAMAQQRLEKLKMIAIGLDLPPEILTGTGDTNHWSAYSIDESTYKNHLQPLNELICAQLGSIVLRDILTAQGRWSSDVIARVVVIGDASALIDHPDQSADAFRAFENRVISSKALRKYLGFPEEDAMPPEEVAQMVEQQRLMHARGSEPQIIPAGDVSGPVNQATTQGNAAVVAPNTNPADSTTAVPTRPTVAASTGPPNHWSLARQTDGDWRIDTGLVAAAPKRPVGKRLADLDLALYSRVHSMAQAAVKQRLERVGAQIMSKAQKHRQIADMARTVPKHAVAASLGQPVVASLGLADDELVGHFDDLLDQVDSQVQKTRDAALTALIAFLRQHGAAPSDAQIAEYRMQASQDAQHGRDRLQRELRAFTHRLLYDANPEDDPVGEGVPAGEVPPGLVRSALAIYGGQTLNDGYSEDNEPLRGVAGGSGLIDLVTRQGASASGWEWVHATVNNPFEPHLELDGEIFGYDLESDAQRMSADISTLWTSYRPGDHAGCNCSIIPEIIYISTDGVTDAV